MALYKQECLLIYIDFSVAFQQNFSRMSLLFLTCAHGQLTSFIRPIADMGVYKFHYMATMLAQSYLRSLGG